MCTDGHQHSISKCLTYVQIRRDLQSDLNFIFVFF